LPVLIFHAAATASSAVFRLAAAKTTTGVSVPVPSPGAAAGVSPCPQRAARPPQKHGERQGDELALCRLDFHTAPLFNF